MNAESCRGMGVDVAAPKFGHIEMSADVAGDILAGVAIGPSC